MKTLERDEARLLRRNDGLSLREIAERIGAAPSSVSRWTRDIVLTADQIDTLNASNRRAEAQMRGSAANRRAAATRRLDAQEHGRTLARAADPIHLAGCMLFWAEGSKSRNVVDFTNSDPDMIGLFLRFLRESYEIQDEQIRLILNCHVGQGPTLADIENWWLQRLGLPPSCLCKHTVNGNSKASSRKRKTLPYGTARLRVCSTFIVQSIYGSIQEYACIDRPEWLDCAQLADGTLHRTPGMGGA